jgi:predicted O-linked N-acetylglucosamine transferase (SPINDLY family)
MGVPVVTLVGESAVSRAGLSQLSNLGLEEFAAFSDDQYVRIAAGLAGDIPRLVGLRSSLRARMQVSLLMDPAHFARSIESSYRAMWRRCCAKPS